MAAPIKKYFGSISLDGVKQSVVQVKDKVTTHEKYGKQLKVTASMWEDGAISIDLWDGEKKEAIKIGRLMVSTFDDNAKAESTPNTAGVETDDLPF